MEKQLFQGEMVRLQADDVKTLAEAHARWATDSTYWRLMDTSVSYVHSPRTMQSWFDKLLENERTFLFSIYTLAENKLIGDISLDGVRWDQGDSYVGIAIGEQKNWGKGYGTDAMKITGLALANGLIAVSGFLFTQQSGFADISMGIGSVILGLGSVMSSNSST